MTHEILQAGNLDEPTPWERGRIFRVFWRTRPYAGAADHAGAPAVLIVGGELIDSWGVCARFPRGREETWAWAASERMAPLWLIEAARNPPEEWPELVVCPPTVDGRPDRVIVSGEETWPPDHPTGPGSC